MDKLGNAIRRAYSKKLTQTDLAYAVGTTQPTVSKWVRGEAHPSLDQLAAIEIACDRPRGFIVRAAGYVAADVGVRAALELDTTISDAARVVLMAAYDAAVAAGV